MAVKKTKPPTLELTDAEEAKLLYHVLRTGNAAMAQQDVEPEVLEAIAGLMVRTKKLLG